MKIITNFPKKLFNKYVSRSDRKRSSFSSTGTTSTESSVSSHGRNQKRDLAAPSPTTVLAPEFEGVYFEMEQAFKLIDADGDGKITKEEMAEILKRVGTEPPNQEELNDLLAELDSDGDGCISLEEFEAISSAFGPPAGYSELKDAFDIFDTDRDGKITAEELLNVFRMIGDGRCTLEDCRQMISVVDKNANGFVGFEDFSVMMELQRDYLIIFWIMQAVGLNCWDDMQAADMNSTEVEVDIMHLKKMTWGQ